MTGFPTFLTSPPPRLPRVALPGPGEGGIDVPRWSVARRGVRDRGLRALLAAVLLGACSAAPPPAEDAPAFVDVTADAGIVHRHHKPVLDSKIDNIMSWMASVGAGVAAADFDDDGWIDLYVTNSRKGEPNYLYRNRGRGADGQVTFSDVAPQAGLDRVNGGAGASMDAIWGDVDNDGDADLYLVRWGRDALFRNHGDGTFSDVTASLFRRRNGEPGTDHANGNAAVFLDYDRDGRLDIYVGNYFKEVDLWNLDDTRIMHDDFERSRNAGPNFLYHQEVDGTFTEVAGELGLDDTGWTLAVGAGDLDGNGRTDLYCANDFGPDQLFLGQDDGTFVNVSATALGEDTKKGMNVDIGDFNNDGWLDVYVTNITTAEYLQEGNMLWLNQGVRRPPGETNDKERARTGLALTDISLESGTYDGGWAWGAKLFDFDNDTDLDIVCVNGFISGSDESYWYDLASWTVTGDDSTDTRNWPPIGDRSFSGYERMRLWRNDGLYSFTEQSRHLGLDSTGDGRGVAAVDIDNDGDLDLYVANQDQPANLYRNDAAAGHWLLVDLETDPSVAGNRDGIGTRVTALVGDTLIVRERDGGNGYAAQSDPRLHFGLGDATVADLLEIRWTDGGYQYLENVAADRILTVRQDPAAYFDGAIVELAAPDWSPPERPTAPAPPEIEPAELARQLADMETRLTAAYDRTLASAYRFRAATYGRHDRALDFLRARVAGGGIHQADWRIELSLAYVDQIPTCGGLAAVVCKGSQARKGLDQLDLVLEADPDNWLALYSRGMNHLHWPRALLHSAAAARDLGRCLELQEQGDVEPFHQRTWLALGQALAKDGRYDDGREVWRRARKSFPDDPELAAHLAIEDDDALLDYVLEQRSLEQHIDTDVSFYP